MSESEHGKYQSLLRRRKAGPIIEKGLSGGSLKARFKEGMIDYFSDKLCKGGEAILEHAEAGGLGAALSVVSAVKGAVDDNAAAKKEVAEVDAVDAIVHLAEGGLSHSRTEALAAVDRAMPLDLLAWPALAPVNEPAIIGHFDALLSEALRESGALSTAEVIDGLKRDHLGDELEEAQTAREKFPQ